MYDIVIIGLGPAGATLARLLLKDYKVLVIDKKSEKGKCCGGLLSPNSQKVLAQFNLCLESDKLVDSQIFSVRTIDIDNNMEQYYQRFYLNMDRSKFDKWLISLIPDNVDRKNGYCNKIIKKDNHFEISFNHDDKEEVINAKIVIGADGASSIVRSTFYPKNKIDRYVSIQEWYKVEKVDPTYICIFDKSITDSYSWMLSKDDNFIIGGAFKRDICNRSFDKLKDGSEKLGFSLKEKVRREGCFVYIPRRLSSIVTGKNGAYLIGEAAGMISPSSLEGISYAMSSASILSDVLNKSLDNISLRYFVKSFKIRFSLILKLLKMPFMYNRFLRKLVILSGISSIKIKNK